MLSRLSRNPSPNTSSWRSAAERRITQAFLTFPRAPDAFTREKIAAGKLDLPTSTSSHQGP
jgi:hypothetical protein